jgi:hypothetical protein
LIAGDFDQFIGRFLAIYWAILTFSLGDFSLVALVNI